MYVYMYIHIHSVLKAMHRGMSGGMSGMGNMSNLTNGMYTFTSIHIYLSAVVSFWTVVCLCRTCKG
jgi:hypothetical protein